MAGFGLEVLFCSAQNQMKRAEDALVCALHWCLVVDGFKTVGIGEEEPKDDKRRQSEMLPAGWNDSGDLYTLLYQQSGGQETFLLKIIRVEDTLLVHFMRMKDESMGHMTLETSNYVTGDITNFDSAYQNTDDLTEKFKTEVMSQIKKTSNPKKTVSKDDSQGSSQKTQKSEQTRHSEDDPLRIGPPRQPRHANPEWADPGHPFQIGRGDLDPLAAGAMGGGGGMIFDPMRSGAGRGIGPSAGLPGNLPRGAVPPGARFDPFGPPDLDRSGNPRAGGGGRAGPDPDHLPPPGYDDMFM